MEATRKDTAWKAPELAATYLNGVRGAIPLATVHLDVMVRFIAAASGGVRGFLDLGCGDGVLGAALLEAFTGAHGVFGDFSEAMLTAARERIGKRDGAVTFVSVDYATPEWLESVRSHVPFDAVVSGFSIHHQPDTRKRALYQEIYTILAPGGVFINIEHVASASPLGEQLFEAHFIDALYHAERARGGAKSRDEVAEIFYHRRDKDANILTPIAAQLQWLEEIGFSDVDCYFKLFELAVFGGRRIS